MKSAFTLVYILLFSLVSLAPMNAQAKPGTWAVVKGWTITGDSGDQSCYAATRYDDNVDMMVLFDNDRVHWIIGNIIVVPEKVYTVNVVASNGSAGTMSAVGLKDGKAVAFLDLNKVAVVAIAEARSIQIQGLGRYNLYGSKAAIMETWECYKTMNSF